MYISYGICITTPFTEADKFFILKKHKIRPIGLGMFFLGFELFLPFVSDKQVILAQNWAFEEFCVAHLFDLVVDVLYISCLFTLVHGCTIDFLGLKKTRLVAIF